MTPTVTDGNISIVHYPSSGIYQITIAKTNKFIVISEEDLKGIIKLIKKMK